MPFDNYHLIVRQLISPQNVWCLSLTRKIYPSHMMWHNLWTQTQNISADVNTFSFHFLNIADQAKFHFTEKATFFALCVEEKNSEGFRHDSWVSLCLDCNLCIFQLKISLEMQGSKILFRTESVAQVQMLGPCLPASHPLTALRSDPFCQKRYSWKEPQECKQKSLQAFWWTTKKLDFRMPCAHHLPVQKCWINVYDKHK